LAKGKNIKLQYSPLIFQLQPTGKKLIIHRKTNKVSLKISYIYFSRESKSEVDNSVFKNIPRGINDINKQKLLPRSLAVQKPLCIQFTGYIRWKSSKCPHHYTWFVFPCWAFKSQFTFMTHSRVLFSFALSLYLFLTFPPSLSLPLQVLLSFLRSVFHVTAAALLAERGLTASLSAVLAVVLLQLLGCDKERREEKFHTNYDTIMKHLVKGAVRMKVKQSLI